MFLCQECRSECDSCFAKNFCTRCRAGFFLHLGKCQETCPEGLVRNEAQRECSPSKNPDAFILFFGGLDFASMRTDTPQRGCLCRVPGRLRVLREQRYVLAVPTGPVPAEREMPPRLPRRLRAQRQTHGVHTPRSVPAEGRSEATLRMTEAIKFLFLLLSI